MTNKKITIKDGQTNNEIDLPVLDSILGPDVGHKVFGEKPRLFVS